MKIKENLTRWAKYNYNIFKGMTSTSETVDNFMKLSSDIKAQGVQSIVIRFIDNESYTLEYIEMKTKKSIKILISDIEAINKEEVRG